MQPQQQPPSYMAHDGPYYVPAPTTYAAPAMPPPPPPPQPANDTSHSEFMASSLSTSASNANNTGTLIVNFIPIEVTEEELHAVFSQFGDLDYSKLVRHQTGMPRGYGFVRFRQPAAAERARASLDGFLMYGKHLRVSFSNPGDKRGNSISPSVASLKGAPIRLPPQPAGNDSMSLSFSTSIGANAAHHGQGYHSHSATPPISTTVVGQQPAPTPVAVRVGTPQTVSPSPVLNNVSLPRFEPAA